MDLIISNIGDHKNIKGYLPEKVDKEDIVRVLKAGKWGEPSTNNHPWKFAVVNKKEIINELSLLTIYEKWVNTAPCLIVVFLDRAKVNEKNSKSYLKNVQRVGACIQNLLLEAHELGLGTCWIGEILKNENKVKKILNIKDDLELMAVISLGYSNVINSNSTNRELADSIIDWY